MRLLKAKVMVMAKKLRENRIAESYFQKTETEAKEVRPLIRLARSFRRDVVRVPGIVLSALCMEESAL